MSVQSREADSQHIATISMEPGTFGSVCYLYAFEIVCAYA
jgi:hypothetical protein